MKLALSFKLLGLVSILFFTSCASSVKKGEVDVEKVTDDDFKQVDMILYNANTDHFKGVTGKYSSALNDESLQRVDDFGGDIKDKDVLLEIITLCYDEKFEKAQDLIKNSQQKYRKNPIFWNQVGTCFSLKKERRKAILFYNKALEFNSSYAPALNNLGVMYRMSGEDQRAEVAFNRAIKSNNFAKTPRFNLAQLYLSYGLFNSALPHLNVLERVSKNDIDVINGLATSYLMKGDFKRADIYFQKIDKKFLSAPYIGINAAIASYLNGDKSRAKSIFNNVKDKELGSLKNYYEEASKRILK